MPEVCGAWVLCTPRDRVLSCHPGCSFFSYGSAAPKRLEERTFWVFKSIGKALIGI